VSLEVFTAVWFRTPFFWDMYDNVSQDNQFSTLEEK